MLPIGGVQSYASHSAENVSVSQGWQRHILKLSFLPLVAFHNLDRLHRKTISVPMSRTDKEESLSKNYDCSIVDLTMSA